MLVTGYVPASQLGQGATGSTVYLRGDNSWVTLGTGGGGLTNINISAGTTSQNLSDVVLSDSNGISFGLNGSTITAQHNALTSQSNQAISASNGSSTFQTASFGNANGMSFLYSGGSVVGSYTVPTITNSSWTISDNATSGTVARLAFTNLNGVTLSLSSGAGGSHTIVGSHNALTSQSNQAFSAAGGSSAFQTLGFSDNSNLSWTNTNGSIAAASVRASMFAVSNTTQSTSGTQNLNAISFAGAGVASVGVTNGSVLISVPAGGGAGFSAGVSNLGNTAGSTGISGTQLVLVGTNNITLSQSTGANGATVSISGPSPGGGGAATLSRFPYWEDHGHATSSAYSGATTTAVGGSLTSYSLYLAPFVVPNYITFNTAGFMISHQTVAGTGSLTNAQMYGLYTLNGDTALSLVSTFHFQVHLSQNSVTARSHYWFWGTNSTSNSSSVGGNISASMTGPRLAILHSQATSLASGEYWLGYMQTMRTSGAAVGSFSAMHASASQTTQGSLFATNISVNALRFLGIHSRTTSGAAANVNIMPASIHTSAITGTGNSSQMRSNIIWLGSR